MLVSLAGEPHRITPWEALERPLPEVIALYIATRTHRAEQLAQEYLFTAMRAETAAAVAGAKHDGIEAAGKPYRDAAAMIRLPEGELPKPKHLTAKQREFLQLPPEAQAFTPRPDR